jgi:hypothetical protein
MKTTRNSNIYYLVRCNHETLQKLFSWPVYVKGIGEKEEREKAKILLKIYPTELLFYIKIEELHNHGLNSEGVW